MHHRLPARLGRVAFVTLTAILLSSCEDGGGADASDAAASKALDASHDADAAAADALGAGDVGGDAAPADALDAGDLEGDASPADAAADADTAAAGPFACALDADCAPLDDGNPCNGKVTCQQGTCALLLTSVIACDASADTACSAQECNPATGTCAAVLAPAKTACEDGDACTVGDHCGQGACLPGPSLCACASDKDCIDDGNLCNGTPFCDKGTFPPQCRPAPGTAVTCDASADTACTQATCLPLSGACTATAAADGAACHDGEPCTVDDACLGGVCKPGLMVCPCLQDADCKPKEDGNLCNGTLVCKDKACVIDPASVVTCDTSGDGPCEQTQCTPGSGACAKGPAATGKPCDDGDACTAGDACAKGACQQGNLVCACKVDADCKAQDDGDACNGTLVCQANQCKTDPASVVTCDASKDSACAKATCEPKSGGCAAVAVADGKACDDGDACTNGDACAGGQCKSGALVCECKVDADCKSKEDGDACNGTLMCKDNACVVNAATVVSCNTSGDGPCAKTACVAATGKCLATSAADGTACDDGDACTGSDACQGGLCKGGASTCGPAWNDVYKQVFVDHGCSGCHGGWDSAADARSKLLNTEFCGGKLVVPGDAAASMILAKVGPGTPLSCGVKMPKGSQGISQSAFAALKAWVEAGAKP